MKLNADIIEGFSKLVLAKNFDDYKTTPECHKEWWNICTSDHPLVAICAPRGHAKSTAITHCYTLASVLFKDRKFVIIISDTYEQSVLFLQDIAKELETNEDLINLFGVSDFVKKSENDIIVRMIDGHRFRIVAKGAEQKMRGIKWDNMRPDLIVCHEEGTDIHTPETGWIKNQDYPGAKQVKAHDAYRITFVDGHTEVVSSDHRFMVGEKWKYPWEMKNGDNVTENISDDTLNAILNDERSPSRKATLSAESSSGGGLNRIPNAIKQQKLITMFVTKSAYFSMLRSSLNKIPDGKRRRALYAEQEKCRQRLRGLICRLSEEFTKQQESDPLLMDVSIT